MSLMVVYVCEVLRLCFTEVPPSHLQYKTEKDGTIETRVEKRVVISSDADDIDHDKVIK